MKSAILLGLVFTVSGAVSGFAGDLTDDQMTSIIRSLAPTVSAPVVAGTPPPPTAVKVTVKQTVIVIDAAHSLDFEVYFPFDSAELTPKARDELTALGRALASDELRDHSYLISGHTDAKGSADYNLDLSARRANAVREFLIRDFPIAPDRLVAAGFGEGQLKVPDAPYAGLNRRVEVALILSRGDR
ncbi:MAG: OmpA family protein [Maritimibacter sp.]|nr:OmpA family protein [Maritimibacter sp.]